MAELQSQKNMKTTGGAGGVVVEGPQMATDSARVAAAQEESMANQFGFVTQAERKLLNVDDNEVTFAARNPEYWQRAEGGNRVQQLAREHGYARVLTMPDGSLPLDGTDNILVALPKAGFERRDKVMQDALKAEMAQFEEVDTDEGAYLETSSRNTFGHEEIPFTKDDQRLMQQLRNQNRAIARASALMGPGSPTNKMTLREAESRYTPEQIEAEEAMHRGRTQQTEMTMERWKAMTSAPDAAKQGRSMFGFSDTGFPRNPKAPVAQAARRRPATT